MVHHRTRVIDVDEGFLFHRSIVATTIGIDDRATNHLQIGLIQLRQPEALFSRVGYQLSKGCRMIIVTLVIDGMCHLASYRLRLHIVEITIATGKELTDVNLSGTCCRLHISGCLAVSVCFLI